MSKTWFGTSCRLLSFFVFLTLALSCFTAKILAASPVVETPITFSDNFNNGRLYGWESINDCANIPASKWAVNSDNNVYEASNYHCGSMSPDSISKTGTYLLGGNKEWADYDFTMKLKSSDNDALGVMFRYQDPNNYYRFSMDKERHYRRLVKKVDGKFTLLAEQDSGYSPNTWYRVRILAVGSQLQIYLNDSLVLDATDPDLTHGQVAFYSWSNKKSYFDSVSMKIKSDSFSFAILPDTQWYSQLFPQIFDMQTKWIANNRAKYNIVFGLHEGDITNRNTRGEWIRARASMSLLDGKLPYAIVPGNHDLPYSRYFNKYFPVSQYSNSPTFGGVFEKSKLDNNYHLFSAGGVDWLVIGLEFAPRDKVLAWADKIAKQYPSRKTVVLTHAYLNADDTLLGPLSNIPLYAPDPQFNDGIGIWDKLVSKNDNLQYVFSGHVRDGATGRLVSIGDHGNNIYQVLADYQNMPNGGNGYLRLVTFYPSEGRIEAKTYSPFLNQYLTDDENQFEFNDVSI